MNAYEGLSKIYDCDWGTWPANYVQLVNKYNNGSSPLLICDLACGIGTLAQLLIDKGHHVHCVDLSEEMLAIACDKFSDDEPITFQHADMSEINLPGKFDIVTCTYDSINYLTTVDQIDNFFRNIYQALKNGGRLVFDCNTENLYLHRHKGAYNREINGESFVHKCIYDSEERKATTIFEFSSGIETHIQRPYALSELRNIFEKKGFCIVDIFAGFKGEEYSDDCERFVCILEKKGNCITMPCTRTRKSRAGDGRRWAGKR